MLRKAASSLHFYQISFRILQFFLCRDESFFIFSMSLDADFSILDFAACLHYCACALSCCLMCILILKSAMQSRFLPVGPVLTVTATIDVCVFRSEASA